MSEVVVQTKRDKERRTLHEPHGLRDTEKKSPLQPGRTLHKCDGEDGCGWMGWLTPKPTALEATKADLEQKFRQTSPSQTKGSYTITKEQLVQISWGDLKHFLNEFEIRAEQLDVDLVIHNRIDGGVDILWSSGTYRD